MPIFLSCGRSPQSSCSAAVLTGSRTFTKMADVKALRFIGVSLGIIASVVVFVALLTVLEASKTGSQTAVLAAVSDQRSWGAS